MCTWIPFSITGLQHQLALFALDWQLARSSKAPSPVLPMWMTIPNSSSELSSSPLQRFITVRSLATLRPKDFIQPWQKAKEQTSSLPSGLHFGHYKAAAHFPELAFLHAQFTQLVFMSGISLLHYQLGLQVLLEKRRAKSMSMTNGLSY